MSSTPKLGLCPDCRAAISYSAPSCPRCGRPISESDLLALPDQSDGCQRGCLIVGLIILVVVLIGMLLHQPLTDEDRMRQIRKNQQTGREMYR
jgi:hypothetical protein